MQSQVLTESWNYFSFWFRRDRFKSNETHTCIFVSICRVKIQVLPRKMRKEESESYLYTYENLLALIPGFKYNLVLCSEVRYQRQHQNILVLLPKCNFSSFLSCRWATFQFLLTQFRQCTSIDTGDKNIEPCYCTFYHRGKHRLKTKIRNLCCTEHGEFVPSYPRIVRLFYWNLFFISSQC